MGSLTCGVSLKDNIKPAAGEFSGGYDSWEQENINSFYYKSNTISGNAVNIDSHIYRKDLKELKIQ